MNFTLTRKSGESLRTTYGNTGQLFQPYLVSSALYTMIEPATTECRAETLLLSYQSTSHTSDTKSTSHGNCSASGGDHSIHCWWDLIRSKQLSSVSVCRTQVFAGFSGQCNSIHNIIPLLKKENVHLIKIFSN